MVNSFKGDGKAIFTIFVGAIIAVVFMASIADQVFTQTTTASQTNLTVTVSAVNVSQAVEGRDLITATSITNVTNASVNLITLGLNLTDGLVSGDKTVILRANDTASNLVGTEVNLTYTYNPNGFITNAGGRSIATLILIIAALAIVVFVIVVLLKFGSLGALTTMFNSRRRE